MTLDQALLALILLIAFLSGYLIGPAVFKLLFWRDYPSIASIKEGDWNDPKTWNQKRIPTVGDIVSVNHVIKLDNVVSVGKDERCKPKLYNIKKEN